MTIAKNTEIINQSGLHARPAGLFVKEATKFDSDIFITFNERKVDAKSIMNLLSMGIGGGSKIQIEAIGKDAKSAIDTLVSLFESGFGEA